MSCIEAETVVALRGGGGGQGGIPGRTVNRHRNRDPIGAEQEAGGPCRLRHAAVAASDGKGNCIEGLHAAMRVRYRLRRKTADRPAKLNDRTPARAA